MVLLKQVDDEGFVFFTNYHSAKAQQLESNPYAALVFTGRNWIARCALKERLNGRRSRSRLSIFERSRGEPDRRVGLAAKQRNPRTRRVGGTSERIGRVL